MGNETITGIVNWRTKKPRNMNKNKLKSKSVYKIELNKKSQYEKDNYIK